MNVVSKGTAVSGIRSLPRRKFRLMTAPEDFRNGRRDTSEEANVEGQVADGRHEASAPRGSHLLHGTNNGEQGNGRGDALKNAGSNEEFREKEVQRERDHERPNKSQYLRRDDRR